jgi:uncharacterized protein (DUF924 family)
MGDHGVPFLVGVGRMKSLASAVLNFWFGEGAEHGKAHKRWFEKDPAFDAEVRSRFSQLHEKQTRERDWLDSPRDCLARIIVLDQFPRHLYRGTARAFSSDALALEAARHLVDSGWDRSLLPVERMFAYLPFQHSESLADQERAVKLYEPLQAFAETADTGRYAIAHRDIIRRFGRFPHRNAALGRASTLEEIEFLKQPGSSF